jgi:hypothetical protein
MDMYDPSDFGWNYIKDHKDRLVKFSYEESSIDLTVTATPRIVVNDVCYDVVKQYFIREDDTTTSRLLLLKPYLTATENGEDYIKNAKNRPHFYNGSDSYTARKLQMKKDEEAGKEVTNLLGVTANSHVATKEENTSSTTENTAETTENEAQA